MRGSECWKRNYILGIGHVSPLTLRPTLPESGRGGERFFVSRSNLDFHQFHQAAAKNIAQLTSNISLQESDTHE